MPLSIHHLITQENKTQLQLLDFTARNCNNIYYMCYNRMDLCFLVVFLTLLIFNTLVLRRLTAYRTIILQLGRYLLFTCNE